jgi:hypothetical protein
MGKAQQAPEYTGNLLSKEKGVSKNGNDYFKVRIDTCKNDLYANGRDYEVLHDAKVPCPIRYNTNDNKEGVPTFLNDVELIMPDDADMPKPPSLQVMREADPNFRDKQITASWAVGQALQQLHYEMNSGKVETFDPVRLTEIAVDFVEVQNTVVEYLFAKTR